MRSIRWSAIAFCLLTSSLFAVADEPQATDTQTSPKKVDQWVAKSEEELARLVMRGIDDEDYAGLQKLLVPIKLHRELVPSEKARANHVAYRKALPAKAKQFRAFLEMQNLLPLTGSKLDAIHTDPKPSVLGGKEVFHNRGLRILRKFPGSDEWQKLEIVDWAIAVEGRWYVRRLVIEAVEKYMQKLADADATQPEAP